MITNSTALKMIFIAARKKPTAIVLMSYTAAYSFRRCARVQTAISKILQKPSSYGAKSI